MLQLNTFENGVAWVETYCGQTFGIVNAFKITDEDGLVFPDKSTIDVLDEFTDIDQDWEREANIIKFDNGSVAVVTADGVDITSKD